MKAAQQRTISRILHLVFAALLGAYVYSPLGEAAWFQSLTRYVALPLTMLSGLWLWKGHLLRKRFNHQ